LHTSPALIGPGDGELELGEAIEACRDEWARTVQASADRARRGARKALERLTTELEALAQAQSIGWWLGHLDQQQSVPHAALGSSPGSAFSQANGAPVSGQVLLGGVGELIDPPGSQQEPREAAAQVPA
jgi:hypothetical protein